MSTDEKALIGWSDGRVLLGHGPFERVTDPPGSGAAFYHNDFGLGFAQPWLVPSRWEFLTPDEVVANLAPTGSPEIAWTVPEASDFAGVFEEITTSIRWGIFEKTVPVVVERGRVRNGDASGLLARVSSASLPLVPYGYACGDGGFAGMSPEHLLVLEGRRLKTMALAGTARADEREVLEADEQEIRAHEFGAQALVSKLGDLGDLRRGPREIMDLGPIVHFHTPVEVELAGDEAVDDLIRRLHPTPALGPLPRTGETMARLIAWRKRLGAPEEFGAPFGAIVDGVFRGLVAIRGIWWQTDRVLLPAGCGVIEASRLVNEWRELRLKREAVKARFGLG